MDIPPRHDGGASFAKSALLLATVAITVVHGAGKNALHFPLAGAAPPASAATMMAASSALVPTLLCTALALSARTTSGTATTPATAPALTASGASGGVIRSNIHCILVL